MTDWLTPEMLKKALDPLNDMIKVSSMQKKFRDSFGGAALDTSKWDVSIGSGGSVAVSGGVLTIGSGNVANSETVITSKEIFTIPMRLSIGLTLSQRIANQTFIVEFISVDRETGVPDGKHCAALLFDGTVATNAKYRVQNSAVAPLDSAAVTINTTASAGVFEIEPFADETWFHSGTLDATTGRANSYRRHQQIPDPNAYYKVRLRWLNGASAPASNTNAAIQYIAVQDYAELTAEITAGRGNSVAGQALSVNVTTMPSVNISALPPHTPHTLNSAATTNATSVKTSAGSLYVVSVSNLSASQRFLKLYNKSSAPTVGTDIPVMVIPLPATSHQSINFGTIGQRFASGIAFAITGAIANADTTAIGANEVQVMMTYN